MTKKPDQSPARKTFVVAIAALLLISLAPTAGARALKGVAKVIDGDSMMVRGVEVRLHSLDAPELEQTCLDANGNTWACGEAARDALAAKVDGRQVVCQRALLASLYIGDCKVDGERISAWLLEQGLAVIDRRGSRRYAGFESKARRAGRNMWAGDFEYPWRWRDERDGSSGITMVLQDRRTVAR
ncbi:MAG: thermonuclease family protein [Pseudomonadota bacterium]